MVSSFATAMGAVGGDAVAAATAEKAAQDGPASGGGGGGFVAARSVGADRAEAHAVARSLGLDGAPARAAAASVRIAGAGADQVWLRLARADRWAEWRATDPRVRIAGKARQDGPLREGEVFRWVAAWAGGGAPVKSVVTEALPGQVVAWTGDSMGLVQTWTRWTVWEEADQDAGETVVVACGEQFTSGCLSFVISSRAVEDGLALWCEELEASFAEDGEAADEDADADEDEDDEQAGQDDEQGEEPDLVEP